MDNTAPHKDALCEKARSFFAGMLCELDSAGSLYTSPHACESVTCKHALHLDQNALDDFLSSHHLTCEQLFCAAFGFALSRFSGADTVQFCVAASAASAASEAENGANKPACDAENGANKPASRENRAANPQCTAETREPAENAHRNNRAGTRLFPLLLDCSNAEVSSYLARAQETLCKAAFYSSQGDTCLEALAADFPISTDVIFRFIDGESAGVATHARAGASAATSATTATNASTDAGTGASTDVGISSSTSESRCASGLANADECKSADDAPFNLCLTVFRKENAEICLELTSERDHSAAWCTSFLESYARILCSMLSCECLADISSVGAADLAAYETLNQTDTALKHTDVLEAFARNIERHPHNILVRFKNASYTYEHAGRIAQAIAQALCAERISAGSHVAILVPRSEWYLLAALGVLTHGSAYVPIDDIYPDNRIAFMLSDTNAQALLVTRQTKEQATRVLCALGSSAPRIALIELDALCETDALCDPSEPAEPNATSPTALPAPAALSKASPAAAPYTYYPTRAKDCAFIVYTSGTTGRPKAIQLTRGGVLNCAEWYVSASNFRENDVYALYSAFTFDMHMVGFFPTLMCGATLDIVPPEIRLDLRALYEHFTAAHATHTYLPTQLGRVFVEQYAQSSLRFLLVVGEKLGAFSAPESIEMYESYGPTETLTFVTAIPVNERRYPNSVGRPVFNAKLYVLDTNRQLVPAGAVGELYIATKQISNGYLNRAAEQAAAFLPNPFDGEKAGYETMYKTGDLVVLLPDNTIGFMGRKDGQVKIRGNRVELAEVTSAIRELDFVEDTTVSTITRNNTCELVAYVALAEPALVEHTLAEHTLAEPTLAEPALSHQEVRRRVVEHIAANKPAYMVPSFVEVLDRIPLNVNGKVDKRALPAPTMAPSQDATQGAAYGARQGAAYGARGESSGAVDNRPGGAPSDTADNQPSSAPSCALDGEECATDEIVKPDSFLEANVLRCVCKVLDVDETLIGTNTNLIDYGLNSLSAILLSVLCKERCNVDCSAFNILSHPSIRAFLQHRSVAGYQPIHVLHESPGKKTLMFVHTRNDASVTYLKLMSAFGDALTFACVDNFNLHHFDKKLRGYKEMARRYVDYLCAYQPSGPYYLGGWSLGGCIAYEMAVILRARGEQVACVYLLDSEHFTNTLSDAEKKEYARLYVKNFFRSKWPKEITKSFSPRLYEAYKQEYYGQMLDALTYEPSRYDGKVVFYKSTINTLEHEDTIELSATEAATFGQLQAKIDVPFSKRANGYEKFATNMNIVEIPYHHDNLMTDTAPASLIAQLIEGDMA